MEEPKLRSIHKNLPNLRIWMDGKCNEPNTFYYAYGLSYIYTLKKKLEETGLNNFLRQCISKL